MIFALTCINVYESHIHMDIRGAIIMNITFVHIKR